MSMRRPSQPKDFHRLLHVARDRTRPLIAKAPSRDEVNDAGLAVRRAELAAGNQHSKLLPVVHDAQVALTQALGDDKRRAELVKKADELLGTALGDLHATEPD